MKRELKSGKFLLNPLNQQVYIFPIASGEDIKEDDLVVVNAKTLQASQPQKASGYYAIGRATKIITHLNGNRSVICRDGIFCVDNADDPENKILSCDIGKTCYFAGKNSVSLDNINTTEAGEIIAINKENDCIFVKITVEE